jgi:TPR repeat protein
MMTKFRSLKSLLLLFTIANNQIVLAQEELAFDAGLAAKDRGHFATAIRAWLPLAEAGSAEAQNNLGHMYEEGMGVSQNYQTAMDWYRRAAEQDLPQAQHNVGLLYYNGYGVQANTREAVRWFRQSADQGLDASEYMMGLAFYEGEGVELDYKEARKWFAIGAKKGYPDSMLMLSFMLLSGDGSEENQSDAYNSYIWSQLTIRLGQEEGDSVRAIAVLQLEDDQVIEADAMVEICLDQGLDSCPI